MHTSSSPSFSTAFPWVLFVTLIFFINYLPRSLVSPLLVPMEAELNMSHSQATGLLLLLSAGFSVSMALSSVLSRVLAHRTVAALSAVAGGLALGTFAFVETRVQAGAAILCFGLSAGLYFPSGMATLASLVRHKDWGKAIAVHELAPNVSFIAAPLIASLALAFMSWREVLCLTGAVSFVLGLMFLFFGRGGEKQREGNLPVSCRSLLVRPRLWLFVVLIGLSIGGEYAPFSVLPLYLVNEKGIPFDTTNSILSASRLACPFVVLAAGIVADRLGTKTAVRLYLIFHGVMLFGVGLASGMLLTGSIIMQALLTAFVFPAVFKLLAEAFTPAEQTTAMSLIMPMAAVLGTGIIPAILGMCGDAGSFGAGFIAMGLMNFAALGALVKTAGSRG